MDKATRDAVSAAGASAPHDNLSEFQSAIDIECRKLPALFGIRIRELLAPLVRHLHAQRAEIEKLKALRP